MRLGLKLLNSGATANCFKHVSSVEIVRGETAEIFVQLVDQDQNGLRYIPSPGATVQLVIPRMDEVSAGPNNTRVGSNPTLTRSAVVAFVGDNSIYKIPLTSSETEALVSSTLKVEVSEGSNKKIAILPRAITVYGEL
jgi:CTP synthase (UTP-ammonia lyase)